MEGLHQAGIHTDDQPGKGKDFVGTLEPWEMGRRCNRGLIFFFFQRDFFELVKNIGEAKSKQEEDFLMRHECKKLQDELREPDSKKLKEYLIRLM